MPKAKVDEHGYTPQNYLPLPNREAIVAFNGKALLTPESYLDVKAYQHALAFTVAGMMDEDLLAETRNAIKSALENGTDFRTFKQRLKPFLMSKGWLAETLDDGTQKLQVGSHRRLRTIYSTNLQSAYSAGQWSRIQQTKEFLPYLQYMKSVSEHPRLDHKKYYGLCRKADDAIWTYIMPQNGWGCKCWVKQLTKKQAQKVGISDDKPLEMEEYVNPKTGDVSQVPKGIDPSFAHNHDRLTALFKLANDKHGKEFSDKLGEQLNGFMLEMVKNTGSMAIADFTGIVPRSSEVDRLKTEVAKSGELPKQERLAEGMVADEWQQYYDVALVRFDERYHKLLLDNDPADFAVKDLSSKPKDWQIIDFMMSRVPTDDNGILAMNHYFEGHKRANRHWKDLFAQIEHHLNKAEVVPIDLRYLSVYNRTKLVTYMLSLSKQQQKQIVLLTGEST